MPKKCSTAQQGYPSITHMKDCQLSHTGFDLSFVFFAGCVALGMGIVALVARGKLKP